MSTQKKVLVTGGAGYIGSHVCKALHANRHIPIVFDNLSTGHERFVKWGPLHLGDITNPDDLNDAFTKHRPDLVMHFAASAYVRESVADPMKYYVNNCLGSLRLLDAMQFHGVNHIVVSSTCAVYGDCKSLPIDESTPKDPQSPYGRSKLFVEQALRDLGNASDLKWVALRYFNAAGSDPDLEIGEDHTPETHIIPLAIQAALGMAPALQIFGDDFDTPDGTAIRDYVHVNDLATAHVNAMTYLENGGASSAFNLGTGTGTSIKDILDTIKRLSGHDVPHSVTARSPGDVPALYASATRANQHLDWTPTQSSLDNIIKTALNWYRHHRTGKG